MFYCTQPQQVVLAANKWFAVDVDITAADTWQTKTLKIDELKIRHDGRSLGDWSEGQKNRNQISGGFGPEQGCLC